MRHFLLSLVLSLLILAPGCSRDLSPTAPRKNPPARPLTAQEQSLARTSNTFGWSLFQTVASEEGQKNTFVSPLSVTLALAMAYNGAANETETAMRSTLGFPQLSREEVNTALSGLSDLLTSLDYSVKFQIANSIWYRQGVQVEPGFIERNQLYYHAPVQALDFASPRAVASINDWASKNTNGRIPQVIDRIDPEMIMFLLNAIYFKGTWSAEFNPKETHGDLFTLADGSQSSCRMMQQTNDLFYFENELVRAVDLPYGDGQFSMAILLPKTNLDDLTSRLDAAAWEEWHPLFVRQAGTLYLPKFKLSYEVMMNAALKSMGMAIAFDDQKADFSGISASADLFISYVKHCSFVQVDEEGTEAAAVTVVGVGTTSIGEPSGFVLRIDRPFMIVIHDHHSQTALFIGRIFQPVWE
jgi:serine protease inhibitor